MMIIGCDFHTRYQQIAMMDEATGELIERRLDHESGEAQAFYREFAGAGARGHRSDGSDSLVRALAGGTGSRVVDRRFREDSRQRGAQAKDR